MKKIIAYYRVSTRKQKVSGLGLDAQRQAVQDYARSIGAKIVAEYTEAESGKRSDRAELRKAIAKTRAIRGTLCIAKLDRLARNVAFTAALMESGVPFICCDNPNATKLTIHILAAVAEDEARRISQRTIDALAAARRKGVRLGTHRPGHLAKCAKGMLRGLAKAVRAAAAQRAQRRDDCYSDLLPGIVAMRQRGLSYAAIAERLNADGHVTVGRGPAETGTWAAMTVSRLLCRHAQISNHN